MSYITANGLNLWVERKGEGEPLLFITGSGSDLRRKPSAMDGPLAKQFDMVAYDQRGLGQTGKPDRPYTMRDYADDAARLLTAVGWRRCHVLGYSFGGMVAQEFAIWHPERIDKLVLCVTSPGGAGGASYPLHELSGLDSEERARRGIALADLRRTPEWQESHPDEVAQFIGQALAAERAHAHEPGWSEGRARQLEARCGHDTFERLGRIAAPTLVCGGRYDGIALAATQERMAARIPNAELRMFEGGHLFVMQDRSAYPAIIDWLKQD